MIFFIKVLKRVQLYSVFGLFTKHGNNKAALSLLARLPQL